MSIVTRGYGTAAGVGTVLTEELAVVADQAQPVNVEIEEADGIISHAVSIPVLNITVDVDDPEDDISIDDPGVSVEVV